jgi:pyruvate dehydrogenase (quinone)
MTKKVADLLVDVLAEAGVQRIYGVVGDSLNGITDSMRVKNNLEWVHVRHEEVGAFAAGAEAHLTGKYQWTPGRRARNGGKRTAHLISGLDGHSSR